MRPQVAGGTDAQRRPSVANRGNRGKRGKTHRRRATGINARSESHNSHTEVERKRDENGIQKKNWQFGIIACA